MRYSGGLDVSVGASTASGSAKRIATVILTRTVNGTGHTGLTVRVNFFLAPIDPSQLDSQHGHKMPAHRHDTPGADLAA